MALPLINAPMYFNTVLLAYEQLLKAESINQENLGGTPWSTVRERFDPWNADADKFPLVNIVYNSGNFDQSRGSHSDQTQSASFIFDCYAAAGGLNDAGEITPRDQRAADELHLLVTQVYYTIMTENNRDVGLPPGIVTSPWVERIEKFIPTESNVPVQGILAARLTISIDFKEVPPTDNGEALEIIRADSDTIKGGLVEQQFNIE